MGAPGVGAPMPYDQQLEEEMETYVPLQEKYYNVCDQLCCFLLVRFSRPLLHLRSQNHDGSVSHQ